jgi:hypothetical protein
MIARKIAVAATATLVAPLVGCACGTHEHVATTRVHAETVAGVHDSTPAQPEARAGDCWALVFLPPETKTVKERVCVKEATEQIEVVPAKYEWVEERVCVKDASKHLEVDAAEYATEEKRVTLHPGQTQWVRTDGSDCEPEHGGAVRPSNDVFCLVDTPPVVETVQTTRVKKPAQVREVTEPAQYETVRRQKLVSAATTRRITIPAEFDTVEKTVAIGKGKMEWERVVCDKDLSADAVNRVKGALTVAGYKTGPMNGQFDAETMTALKQFQSHNRLGVGVLSYKTFQALGVPVN